MADESVGKRGRSGSASERTDRPKSILKQKRDSKFSKNYN